MTWRDLMSIRVTWRATLLIGVVLLLLSVAAAMVVAATTGARPWLVIVAAAGGPLGLIIGSLIRGFLLKK